MLNELSELSARSILIAALIAVGHDTRTSGARVMGCLAVGRLTSLCDVSAGLNQESDCFLEYGLSSKTLVHG